MLRKDLETHMANITGNKNTISITPPMTSSR
jgi:hypothetical protein